jgi:hypothetical protein
VTTRRPRTREVAIVDGVDLNAAAPKPNKAQDKLDRIQAVVNSTESFFIPAGALTRIKQILEEEGS